MFVHVHLHPGVPRRARRTNHGPISRPAGPRCTTIFARVSASSTHRPSRSRPRRASARRSRTRSRRRPPPRRFVRHVSRATTPLPRLVRPLRARRYLCRDLLVQISAEASPAATCSCKSRRRHLRRRTARADLGGGISGGDLPVQISAEASTSASPVVQPGAGGHLRGDLLVQISPEVTPAAIGSNRSSPVATSAAPWTGPGRSSGTLRALRAPFSAENTLAVPRSRSGASPLGDGPGAARDAGSGGDGADRGARASSGDSVGHARRGSAGPGDSVGRVARGVQPQRKVALPSCSIQRWSRQLGRLCWPDQRSAGRVSRPCWQTQGSAGQVGRPCCLSHALPLDSTRVVFARRALGWETRSAVLAKPALGGRGRSAVLEKPARNCWILLMMGLGRPRRRCRCRCRPSPSLSLSLSPSLSPSLSLSPSTSPVSGRGLSRAGECG